MKHPRKTSPAKLDREIASALKLEPPRIRRLGYVTGLPVYLVSGEQVRNQIDIDFTQGGNEAAYPGYVPPGEIWIDDAMHALDRIATIFHEIVERNLVLYGGMDYDDAHDIACKREIELRKKLAATASDVDGSSSRDRSPAALPPRGDTHGPPPWQAQPRHRREVVVARRHVVS